jgi:hypothetical protein
MFAGNTASSISDKPRAGRGRQQEHARQRQPQRGPPTKRERYLEKSQTAQEREQRDENDERRHG